MTKLRRTIQSARFIEPREEKEKAPKPYYVGEKEVLVPKAGRPIASYRKSRRYNTTDWEGLPDRRVTVQEHLPLVRRISNRGEFHYVTVKREELEPHLNRQA